MRGAATILHADLDAFYAAVEIRDNPALRGRPVAVGGGVVLSASYEARRFGVRAALSGGEARRRCPHLIEVPARFEAYGAASRQVMSLLECFTPEVQPISIDEAFLDVAGSVGLFGTPTEIGRTIRAAVRREVGLPISVGVATTKHLAKIASQVAKPDGLVTVPPGEETAFLDPLPVSLVWGVGPVGEQRLARYGITTIGELRRLPESIVAGWFGPGWGIRLSALANNVDARAVTRRPAARSVGAQSAGDATAPERRHTTLLALSERVASRLRRSDLAGRRVTVRIRLDDMRALTRARVLPGAVSETTMIFRTALELIESLVAEHARRRRVTLVGVALSLLERAPHLQLTLPLGEEGATPTPGSSRHRRLRDLDAAVDRARSRFGRPAITRASLLDSPPESRSPLEAMGDGEGSPRQPGAHRVDLT